MNLSEVSKFQVSTCLFLVCLIIGIAVVDHKQNIKLKLTRKSQSHISLIFLQTMLKDSDSLSTASDNEQIKRVGILIQTAKIDLDENLAEDFKKDLDEAIKKVDEKLKEIIGKLIEDIDGDSTKTTPNFDKYKARLDVIKKSAVNLTEQNYKDVEAKLDKYKKEIKG